MSGISDRIMRRVRGKGRGDWVCTSKDFLDFGSRASVDQALSRLAHSGDLRRAGRGLYYLPRWSDLMSDWVVPDRNAIVAAISRRDGITVVPDGCGAANYLGLTTAVLVRNRFWTDGRTCDIPVGRRTFEFRHRSPRVMCWVGRPSQLVAHGLYWIGRHAIRHPRILRVLRDLPDDIKRDFISHSSTLPYWMDFIVRDLSSSGSQTR